MRAAGGDAQRRGRRRARAQRRCRRRRRDGRRRRRARACHSSPVTGACTTPKHRHAVVDQRDVDGELAVALDELARAVERIDQPQRVPVRGARCAGTSSADSSDSTGMSGRQPLAGLRRCSGARPGRRRSAATGRPCARRRSRCRRRARIARRRVARQRDHAFAQCVSMSCVGVVAVPCRSHFARDEQRRRCERPSEKSSRSISSCSASSFHGTTSSSSGSSPGRRSRIQVARQHQVGLVAHVAGRQA